MDAATQPAALYCQSCDRDVWPAVAINDAGQLVKACPKCQAVLGGAITKPLFKADPKAAVRALEPKDDAVARVLPIRGSLPAVRVTEVAPRRTTIDIVEDARIQLAELDVDIPSVEADLAQKRAHRRGLAKMIAAYDRGATKPARQSAT